jgi:poly-gamma-glutamate synthesis protein (capsule biosynthesis protein)
MVAAVLAPPAVAPGGRLVLHQRGAGSGAIIEEHRRHGSGWRSLGSPPVRLTAPGRTALLRFRVDRADGTVSPVRRVRVRDLRLDAVGDINLGDGPGAELAAHGGAYPWTSVGPVLRAADLSFGNLECAVSRRGSRYPKEFNFRGRPSFLPAVHRFGGLDVLNLANNHSGDFGRTALRDTLRNVRRDGMVPIGAGSTAARAYRARIVRRLGLRVAFVGFSVILPFEFRASGHRAGTAWGFPDRVRSAVRAAHRHADVVIASFHWGIERRFTESAAQRALAQVALRAGATAVIGAHPHVLQPIVRRAHGRLIAYSLGNFVFSASSPGTERTGILELRLAAGRVAGAHLRRAHIVASRPVLS